MNFETVKLEHQKIVKPYLYRYGENSCQHSFAAMFCMAEKYGDSVCEKDGWLFVHRAGISSMHERAYLFPMGDTSDEDGLKRAIELIIADAEKYGATVRFETVTEGAKDAITRLFPNRFSVTALRDYSEYLYTYEKLATLSGHEMSPKRYDINNFCRTYKDRVLIEQISERHFEEIRSFQREWLNNRLCGEEDVQLELENHAIMLGLSNFFELGLSGIVIYIDGEMCGYAYGSPLSENCYDVMIEKGDRRIADIYKVLNRDLVRVCCGNYRYINREEDVGVEGLRKAKLSYKPDLLLSKYLLREVR